MGFYGRCVHGVLVGVGFRVEWAWDGFVGWNRPIDCGCFGILMVVGLYGVIQFFSVIGLRGMFQKFCIGIWDCDVFEYCDDVN